MSNRVFLDTAPLIYLFERQDEMGLGVRRQIGLWLEQNVELVSSTLTLTELLVHPERQGNRVLARRYRHDLEELLAMPLAPLSAEIAAQAATLRAQHALRTPDAVQLATAQLTGCTLFYTHDRDLPKITGLTVLQVGKG